MNKERKNDSDTEIGGVLGAIEKLAKLAESLQNAQGELNREGEIDLGKNSKAAYHFRVRTLGDLKRESSKPDFKPFEKSAPPKKKSADTPQRTNAEPETDVFVEGNAVVIYAQLSGVSESDITLDAHADRIEIRAKSASVLYEKIVPLPETVQPETLVTSYKNGILEIRLTIQQNA